MLKSKNQKLTELLRPIVKSILNETDIDLEKRYGPKTYKKEDVFSTYKWPLYFTNNNTYIAAKEVYKKNPNMSKIDARKYILSLMNTPRKDASNQTNQYGKGSLKVNSIDFNELVDVLSQIK